jgi:hypothetical protein
VIDAGEVKCRCEKFRDDATALLWPAPRSEGVSQWKNCCNGSHSFDLCYNFFSLFSQFPIVLCQSARCAILFDHFLNYLPRRLTPCTSNEDTTPKVKKKMRGLALSRNHVNQTSSLVSGLAGLATLMLACLALAALISLRAWTIALLAVMVRASVTTMAVWLCLNRNGEVLSRLSNSVDQDLITIWPFSLKLFLLVVLSEGRLSDFIIEKSDMCSFECSLAGGVCAFDLGVLVTADTISVVVDGCLEDYTNYQLIPSKVRKNKLTIVQETINFARGIALQL